jgi:hypothetical protein
LVLAPLVVAFAACNALTGADRLLADVSAGGTAATVGGAGGQGGAGAGTSSAAGAGGDAGFAAGAGTGGANGGFGGSAAGGSGGSGGTDPLFVPNCPMANEPAGSGTSCGAGPPDLASVIFNSLESEVRFWPETATLVVTEIDRAAATISFSYDKGTVWPNYSQDIDVNANMHIIACVDGQWFGGSWEWLRAGQNDWTRHLEVPADRIGCQTQNGGLNGHVMHPGDPVGFMVTGLSRGPERNVLERSNLVMTTWPS